MRILMLVVVLLTTGCGLEDLGLPHPVDKLDYPVELTADPSGSTLWVSSGNFDLAYGGGAILGIDVATQSFLPGAAAEVGSFPGELQLLTRDGKAAHGYVLSRETNQLYHLTIGTQDGSPTLDCQGGIQDPSGLIRCATAGLSGPSEDSSEDPLKVGSDPFGAFLRPARVEGQEDLLLSGALGEGLVATFELAEDGTPTLVGNLKTSSPVFSLAENPATGLLYTTSKKVNVLNVYRVRVVAPGIEPPAQNPWLELVDTIVLPTYALLNMDHARGLAFTQDGARLLVLHRTPSAVYLVDVRGIKDTTQEQVLTKVNVCSQPGRVEMVPPSGDGAVPELAYISCFGIDGLDVIDPTTGQHVAHIRTGRGPFGMAFIENATLGIRRLYVANFHSQSVGVVELDPQSPYFHTQIAEIR